VRSVLFCNEVLGLGHLRISAALAGELAARRPAETALVVTGAHGFGTMSLPPGVDLLKLPTAPLGVDPSWPSGEVRQPAELALAPQAVSDLRARLSLTAVQAMLPDVVVVDHAPLGRAGDLRPALEWIRSGSGATVALGLRDFDDAPEMRSAWTPEVVAAVSELYDLAIVYGDGWSEDPRLEALGEAEVPVHRTGLVGTPSTGAGAEDLGRDYLLVTVGGGVDGFPLLACVLEALEAGRFEHPTVLVTGPMMPAADVARLARRASRLPVRLERERGDMAAVIARARAVIAMAGYSTVAEILGSGIPALLVPRVHPREEQLGRARYWAASGQVRMLDPRQLDSVVLGEEIALLLAETPREPLELSGAAQAADILTFAATHA
jgi:predicted glycosyltransferase